MGKIERLEFLDITKGFAILLVVIGHIFEVRDPIKLWVYALDVWIYSFHMPLFFIVSGILSYNKDRCMKETFIKKFKSLMIPYITFSICMIGLKILLDGGITDNIKSYIVYFVTGVGMDALWFLPCLFIVEMICCTLNNYVRNKYILILILLSLFIIGLFGNNPQHNLLLITIYRSFIGLGFFVLGKYSHNFIINENIGYILGMFLVLISAILSVINGQIDLWGLILNNRLLYVLCSVTTSIVVILLIKKVSNINHFKILIHFGMNSLIIMSTHQFIIQCISKLTNQNSYDTISGFIVFIVIMLIELPFIYIINNYMFWMLGKFNKKKRSAILG